MISDGVAAQKIVRLLVDLLHVLGHRTLRREGSRILEEVAGKRLLSLAIIKPLRPLVRLLSEYCIGGLQVFLQLWLGLVLLRVVIVEVVQRGLRMVDLLRSFVVFFVVARLRL